MGRVGFLFRGYRDASNYHPRAGEYSAGGTGNFVEFCQFSGRGGDKMLEKHLKTIVKMVVIFSKLHRMI